MHILVHGLNIYHPSLRVEEARNGNPSHGFNIPSDVIFEFLTAVLLKL
jgi:hypothetical protein